MNIVRLVGQSAHSEHRRLVLLKAIQEQLPTVKSLSTREAFIIRTTALEEAQHDTLKTILEAQDEISPEESKKKDSRVLWVTPRWGTQSSWGSKARDILHHVGLTGIQRIEKVIIYSVDEGDMSACAAQLHDRMTESVAHSWEAVARLFEERAPQPLETIALRQDGKEALMQANRRLGLALSAEEIDYLASEYQQWERDPTDVELMMFAQANSEHCRHKIFKARWEIDGQLKPHTLFDMIRHTYTCSPQGVLSAYQDNASVIQGTGTQYFYCDPRDRHYRVEQGPVHVLMKVETHNHPTAIEPFAGAGTGQGGEIRDEGATGRGAKPKAGLTGFSVSHLHIPGYPRPWEKAAHYPARIASAWEIMQKAPLGGAAFNNEFGRPNIAGYFRVLERLEENTSGYFARGYHKPIMIAGGMGNIREAHVKKQRFSQGACLIVLGGPAMKIGLGGGAASSVAQGVSEEGLDFASVQRQNPEMQRRCQEVINHCCALGDNNPIVSIHDVGAGGLANALPELVHDADLGATLSLRAIPNAEPGMTPLEIWCNESQERYVLAIERSSLALFESITQRERCPFAVLGEATTSPVLRVTDDYFHSPLPSPIDIPQALLFGNTPTIVKKVSSVETKKGDRQDEKYDRATLLEQVLTHPSVADKSFLITIGDRSVGGLVARDQMVGPWQIPVSDCAVTATHFEGTTGEAMAMGERPGLALIDAAASARMAVAESVQNIMAASVEALSDIRLSCNWMAAADRLEEAAALFAAVEAVGLGLCPAWGIAVPVGKDSLSMSTTWEENHQRSEVVSPVTLVVSAFAPVSDCRQTLTPLLVRAPDTVLILIDLANHQKRLGGSIASEITHQTGGAVPDVDDPSIIKRFVEILHTLKQQGIVLAYHDRSDGGLWTTLCEMAFASQSGLKIDMTSYASTDQEVMPALLNEECGVVIQIAKANRALLKTLFSEAGLEGVCHEIATLALDDPDPSIVITHHQQEIFSQSRKVLQALWSETSFRIQQWRDHPRCAQMAYDNIVQDSLLDLQNSNVSAQEYKQNRVISAPMIMTHRPKVAILREQGVNGHVEMAAAFTLAGFDALDVTMSDLIAGEDLTAYHGLAVCGGFSYGDVLGAGKGWAATILHQPRLQDIFHAFFHRPTTFTIGVCNGCQMLSNLSALIPGAEHWPVFGRNDSEQFEARLVLVEICSSSSILLEGMEGVRLPVVVSHGEGKAIFSSSVAQERALQTGAVCLRYINNQGEPTIHYPENPNGSPGGITGLTTQDGRVTIMMPHPERVFKAWQLSWHPPEWKEDSPWMRLFNNAKLYYAY